MSKMIENLLIKSHLFALPSRTLLHSELAEIIVDATESRIERPQYHQRRYYSGKKKMHTQKTQVTQDAMGRILRVHFASGSEHDKHLYDRSKLHTSRKTKKRMDLGYK
jgi:hypothetical protein